MKIEVWIENSNLEYDTVKNFWLSDLKTEDKNTEQKEFYIYINTMEELFEVVRNVGEDIIVTMLCDEPLIKFI